MSTPILIIGKSGSGKSRSICTLDHTKTFLINVCGKELPFKGSKLKYKSIDKTGNGNTLNSDDFEKILSAIKYVDESRPEIEVLVIDDFQYIMANEFMRRAKEKGYEKFTEIGEHTWTILWGSKWLRNNLFIVFLAHSETTESGDIKCKTIGKLLDDKICVEGMFTIVLNTSFQDGKFFFETQNNGKNTSKSPEGMFTEQFINNDLNFVIESIKTYNNTEA